MSLESPETKIHLDTRKITAVWAFSESALGGILHALKIPFTGLFIGGAAVFFICLLARFGKNKSEILQSTLIVILVKTVTSPFTPLNSFVAVFLQGLAGYLLFKYLPSYKLASIVLGIIAMLLASLQKVFVMTILFGVTFWESIDSFVRFTFSNFLNRDISSSFSVSLILISLYTLLHLIAGIYVGLRAMNVEQWLMRKQSELNTPDMENQLESSLFEKPKKSKRRKWWQRKSGITILVFFTVLMIISYLIPQLGKSVAADILFMLIRSIIITFAWFLFISPVIIKLFNRYVDSKKNLYSEQVNSIAALFPSFKNLISYSWRKNSTSAGIRRIKKFLSDSLALLLLTKNSNG